MTDVAITRVPYNMMYNEFEFIGPLGSPYVYHLLSKSPREIQNNLTLIKPFDEYVWAFLAVSVISVAIALVSIDTAFASWSNTSKKGILLQSIGLCILSIQNHVHDCHCFRYSDLYWSYYR